jgi:hypothetical protein
MSSKISWNYVAKSGLKVLKKNPRAIDVMAKRDGKALREVFS